MKKIIVLSVVTMMLIMTAIITPFAVEKALPSVNTAKLSTIKYTDSVTALGEVEQFNARYIKSDTPLVAGEILISNGQVVQNGEAVLEVDKDATANKMLEMTQFSNIIEYGAVEMTYDTIIEQLPETICSDVTGTISNVNVSAGDYITEDTEIASIIGSTDLLVKVSIPESDINKIIAGQKCIITGNAFSGHDYNGVVEEISGVAVKQYVGTLQDTCIGVKIRFSDADEAIRVGNTAKVKILTSEEKNADVLPYEAVNSDEEGNSYVYVFNSGVAVKKEIDTGKELQNGIEVIEGVESDDTVVYSDEHIKDGEYIKLVRPNNNQK